MKNITRKLALIGALMLTAVTANAATLTIRLVNVSFPQWGVLKSTYLTALDSYAAIYAGQGIAFNVDGSNPNSIDFVYSGVAFDYYETFYETWAGQYLTALNSAVQPIGLRYEIIYDGVALAETKVAEIRQWWPYAANLGDYWSWTEGMGYFWINYYPWVYSWITTGWLYTYPIEANQFFYWIPGRGWVYSDGDIDNLWDVE